MSRLWNGRPFRNYWNDSSVEKRSEFIQAVNLEDQVKNTSKWEDLETHHQAKLREILKGELD